MAKVLLLVLRPSLLLVVLAMAVRVCRMRTRGEAKPGVVLGSGTLFSDGDNAIEDGNDYATGLPGAAAGGVGAGRATTEHVLRWVNLHYSTFRGFFNSCRWRDARNGHEVDMLCKALDHYVNGDLDQCVEVLVLRLLALHTVDIGRQPWELASAIQDGGADTSLMPKGLMEMATKKAYMMKKIHETNRKYLSSTRGSFRPSFGRGEFRTRPGASALPPPPGAASYGPNRGGGGYGVGGGGGFGGAGAGSVGRGGSSGIAGGAATRNP